MRECLVEGDVTGETPESLFKTRESVFEDYYQISAEGYRTHSMQEIQKINSITSQDEICLWFENDLFCQVNLWFVVYYVNHVLDDPKLYLVVPIKNSWKGFGALNSTELMSSLDQRRNLDQGDQSALCNLWVAYTHSNWDKLRHNAARLKEKIEHIEEVIQAHIDRFPTQGELGRPQKSLLNIINELKDPSFQAIFAAFCQKEGIYGFGDMQVNRLLKELNP